MNISSRFKNWQPPQFDKLGMTKWMWMCQYHENLVLGKNVDVGAFTYINAKYGVEIGDDVQIGSHCSIYSISTIDDKKGKVVVKKGAKVGSHCTIMPSIVVGKGSVVGAHSFVNADIPDGVMAFGIPVKLRFRNALGNV